MNVRPRYAALGTVCLLALAAGAAPASAGVMTFTAGTGNHVYTFANASNPDPNTANCCGQVSQNLVIGILDTQTFTGRGFLRFPDVATLGTTPILDATLRLYRYDAQQNATSSLWRLTDAFDPGDVATGYPGTPENAALFKTPATFFANLPAVDLSAGDQLLEIDVTSIVQDWQANSYTNAFGFGIRSNLEAPSNNYTRDFFRSPLATANVPELVITTPTVVPEPATVALLIFGGLGLAACAGRRRRWRALGGRGP
jgi:hypothetical protein